MITKFLIVFFFEDDLLVNVPSVVFFDDFLAELIQSPHNSFFVSCSVESVCLLLFRMAVNSLVVSKQLGKVLWLSIGDRPLEFAWVKHLFFGTALRTSLLLICIRIFLVAIFSCWLLFFFLLLFFKFFKLFIFELGRF